MAGKRKTSAKKTAEKKAARKVDAKAGAARAEGRKRNREMRDALAGFNSTQLKNLLKGLTPETIVRLAKALEKIEKEKIADAINAKIKKIETLQKEVEELEKAQG